MTPDDIAFLKPDDRDFVKELIGAGFGNRLFRFRYCAQLKFFLTNFRQ